MLVRAQWYLRGAPPFRAVDPAGTLDAEIARAAIIYGAPPERIRRSHRGAILFFRHARVFIVAPVPAPAVAWIIPGAPGAVRHVPWPDFAAANPDVVGDVLEQFRAKGEAYLGGGAAPLVRIVPAAWSREAAN